LKRSAAFTTFTAVLKGWTSSRAYSHPATSPGGQVVENKHSSRDRTSLHDSPSG
jgi:hypothetical protein